MHQVSIKYIGLSCEIRLFFDVKAEKTEITWTRFGQNWFSLTNGLSEHFEIFMMF